MADLKISLGVVGDEIVVGALRRVGEVALNALGAALGKVADFAVDSFKGAIDAQAGIDRLSSSITRLGDASPVSIDRAFALSQEFKNLVGGSDDVVLAMQDVILRFDKIGAETFPQVIEQSADLAVALGVDPVKASELLGKVLQDLGTDGVGSVGRLKAAGVALTEEQEKLILSLVETGDVAGAQNVLLDALAATTGGKAADAAGTLAGKWAIFQETIADAGEGVMLELIPPLTALADAVLPVLMPLIEQGAASLGRLAQGFAVAFELLITGKQDIGGAADALAEFANDVIPGSAEMIRGLAGTLENFIAGLAPLQDWLAVAIPLAVQTLSDLWNTTLLPAIQGAGEWIQTELLPLLSELWDILFKGAQEAGPQLADFWNNVLLPAFQGFWAWTQENIFPLLASLWEWLKSNLPGAIQTLVDFYNNVWLPAQIAVYTFILEDVIPLLGKLFDWLKTTIPQAIQTLSDFWNNTLLPAITAVWKFIDTDLLPLFKAMQEFFDAALTLAVTAMAGLWENVLAPALQIVWALIKDDLQPVIEALTEYWRDTLGPAILGVKTSVLDALPGVFESIRGAIAFVVDRLNDFTAALRNVQLPDWLTPGSPTPFELGLRGIGDALGELHRIGVPEIFQLGERTGIADAARAIGDAAQAIGGAGRAGGSFVDPWMAILGAGTIFGPAAGNFGFGGGPATGGGPGFGGGPTTNSVTNNYYGVQADMQAAYTRALAGAF